MMYFNSTTGQAIQTEDLIQRYGSLEPVPQLGIYDLTYQPDFIPFAFKRLSNATYLPIKEERQFEIDELMAAGYTEAEAEALLDD
jgi:hypothetical protein